MKMNEKSDERDWDTDKFGGGVNVAGVAGAYSPSYPLLFSDTEDEGAVPAYLEQRRR